MTSTAIAKNEIQKVCMAIAHPRFSQQLAQALPDNVSIKRFTRTTLTAIQNNEKLVEADRGSLFLSITRAAQDGLLPDGRESALVIFKRKDGTREVVYMPMIGGFRKIAAEHGWTIDTQVVYEHDEFDYELGASPRLRHKPPKLSEPRGRLIGAYARGVHDDGRQQVEVMTAEQVAKVRAVSRAKDYGPWKDWEERMWEKTAGRRLFAKLPLTGERVQRVLEAADEESDLDGEYAEADLPSVGEFIDAAPLPKEEDGAVTPSAAPGPVRTEGDASSSESGEEPSLFQPPPGVREKPVTAP